MVPVCVGLYDTPFLTLVVHGLAIRLPGKHPRVLEIHRPENGGEVYKGTIRTGTNLQCAGCSHGTTQYVVVHSCPCTVHVSSLPEGVQWSRPIVIHFLNVLLLKVLKRCLLGLSNLDHGRVRFQHPFPVLLCQPPYLQGPQYHREQSVASFLVISAS